MVLELVCSVKFLCLKLILLEGRFKNIIIVNVNFSTNKTKNEYKKIFKKGAWRTLIEPNAGGKSEVSEALSMQFLAEKMGAKNFVLEMDVEYWIDYKMVDYLCTINGKRIGVSVTRALGFPSPEKFTYDSAVELLDKKLYGLIVSRNGIKKEHSFYQSILHIWCQTEKIANYVKEAFEKIDIGKRYQLDIRTDIKLLLTVSGEKCIYKNINIFAKNEKVI